MATNTANLGLKKPTVGADQDVWGGLLNETLDNLDISVQLGQTLKSLSNTNVTLSPLDAAKQVIALSGTLTANVSVIFPSSPVRNWLVVNNTTGNFTVTLRTLSGIGVKIKQGTRMIARHTGTDIENGQSKIAVDDVFVKQATGSIGSPNVSFESRDIQPVNVANALQSDGSFPTSAQEEQAILFSGQNEDHLLPKVGPSLGFILFQPAQEVMTGYVHSRTDLARNTTLNRRAMPLVTLKSFCGNSPIDLKLFKADVVLDGTINRFKYTGAYPIHGILQGSITFLLRLGTDATAKAKLRLSLVYLNAPNITAGQTNRLDLGVSLASVQSTPEALLRSEFRDSDKSDLGALSGLWVRKHINVCQDVVFYPDTTYYFALSVLPEAGGVVDTNYGFRYESGGLSMVFDASANIKELAKNNLIA